MKKFPLLIISLFILTSCNNSVTVTPGNNPQIQSELKANKTLTVGKTPHGIGQASGFIYNSNIGEGTISVIEAKNDTIVKTITVENGVPGYVKAFHDGKNILITGTKKGELLVIDPAQDHKIIQKIALGIKPDKIRISEDDKTVFVSLTKEDKVISLTFASDRSDAPARKDFKVGNMLADSAHRSLAITDEWLLIPNIADNDVSLININTGKDTRLKDGNNPAVVEFGIISGKVDNVIVGNSSSNTVTIFDINSEVKKTLSDVGLSPTDCLSLTDMNRTFITMAGSDEVAVIDYSNKTLLKKIPVGKRPVHIYSVENNNKSEIWVSNDAGASVTVIDPETMTVKRTIKVGKGHHKMAFTSEQAFVSNISDNTISVIDLKISQ